LAERGLHPAAAEAGLSRDSDSGAFREFRTTMLSPGETRGVLLFAIQQLSPPELLATAALAVPAESAVAGIDHVVVRTSDAEAARRLYGDQLGIRLALDRSFEQWGARLLFFRLGGITIEIAASLTGEVDSDAADELWGVAYRVPDADAARARLDQAGFDVSETRPGRKPGTRVFSVRAPTHGVATLCLEPTAQEERAGG
jgi:catechol 2,3-dioxygenase-like lactoylglutathione lyase family enzyme